MKITPQPPFSRALDVQPSVARRFIINPDRKRKRWMMKVFSHTKWILLILVIVLVGCCEVAAEPTEVTQVKTATEIAVPSATVTMTPTVTETIDESVISPENVNRLQVVHQIGDGVFAGVDISPDASKIAIARSKGVYIYDYESLELLNFIPAISVYQSSISDVDFFPDSTFVAISYSDSIYKAHSLNGNTEKIIAQLSWGTASDISVSPSGEQIIVSSGREYFDRPCDGFGVSISIYDLRTNGGLLYSTLSCSSGAPTFYKFFNDGTVAIVGPKADSFEAPISIVDFETGNVKQQYDPGIVEDVNHDGSQAVVWKNGEKIVDTISGEVLEEINGHTGFINESLKFYADDWKSNTFIFNSNGNVVCEFDESFQHWHGSSWNNYGLSRNIDENLLFIPNIQPVINNTITIWNLNTCSVEKELPISWMNDSDVFQYSPDGKIIITHTTDSVDFWDAESGDIITSFLGKLPPYSRIYIADFDDNGYAYVLYTKENEDYIAKINLSTGETIDFAEPFTDVFRLDVSPNGEYFHLGNLYKSDGSRVKLPPFMEFLSFNLSGNTAAYKNLTDIVTIDLQTGEELNRFTVSDSYDFAVYISDNLERLIIPHFDEPYEIWSMEGEFLAYREEFADYNIPLTEELYWSEPSINPSAQAFNPSATLFISAQRDMLRIWDTSTGKLLREMRLPFWVEQMDFSPDGTQLAILSDGVTYFWGVPTE